MTGAGAGRRVALLLAGAYVLSRVAAVLSCGHLMFHLDRAEYGILAKLRHSLDRSTAGILFDSEQLTRFGQQMLQVGDSGRHVSLLPTGLAFHFLHRELGVPVSTLALRGWGLLLSTGALLLWMRALRRGLGGAGGGGGGGGRGGDAAWRFAMLWIVAPALLFKLQLIAWGAHEVVILVHAAILATLGSWVGRPAESGRRAAGRAAIVGVVGALGMALNTSLVLPLLGLGLWLSAEAAWRAVRGPGGRPEAGKALAVHALCGAGAFVLAWQIVARIPLLRELGLSPSLLGNDKLSSLPGQGLAGAAQLAQAFAESKDLWPAFVAAAWVLADAARGRARGAVPPFARFLAAYLFLGWFGIALMPFAYLDDGNTFGYRYLAHLYPVAAGVLAAWSLVTPRPRMRLLGLAAVLLLQAPVLWKTVDLGNLRAGLRYDGALACWSPLWGVDIGPPEPYTRLGGTSRSFRAGLQLWTVFQNADHASWRSWRELSGPVLADAVRSLPYSRARGDAPEWLDRPDYERGLGYALSVLVPPGRAGMLEEAFALGGTEMREGYALGPSELSWRAGGERMPEPRPEGAGAGGQD